MTSAAPHAPEAHILGVGQTDFVPSHRASRKTSDLLFLAAQAALADADLSFADLDGLGIASFTAAPDHSIDLAVRWNIRPTWLMDSSLGGASGNDLLAHAKTAIAQREASTILLVAGDHFAIDDFEKLVRHYNTSAAEDFASMPAAGPNAFFALITQMQMQTLGLQRDDYGQLVVSQRAWAMENPKAAYRDPLTLDEYLAAPIIADPLGRYDCVPVVSGAVAIVVSANQGPIRVLAVQAQHNWDGQNTSGLHTGLVEAAPALWQATGRTPSDLDVASIYDDYPAMVVAQLLDAGILSEHQTAASLNELLTSKRPAINSSGGQLSAGQAGAAAGLHGIIEIANALLDRGPLSTHGSTLGLVTGYGMVAYRYGACANASLLERT
jgi:acetyl-CoA acetyltransferase